jgi:hypothetical protein
MAATVAVHLRMCVPGTHYAAGRAARPAEAEQYGPRAVQLLRELEKQL